MHPFAIIILALIVYFGWKNGRPMKRKHFIPVWILVVVVITMFKWATNPNQTIYRAPEKTTEQVGAEFISTVAILAGGRSLGRRLKDAGVSKPWAIALSVFSFTGIPWIYAGVYPSRPARKDPAVPSL